MLGLPRMDLAPARFSVHCPRSSGIPRDCRFGDTGLSMGYTRVYARVDKGGGRQMQVQAAHLRLGPKPEVTTPPQGRVG